MPAMIEADSFFKMHIYIYIYILYDYDKLYDSQTETFYLWNKHVGDVVHVGSGFSVISDSKFEQVALYPSRHQENHHPVQAK